MGTRGEEKEEMGMARAREGKVDGAEKGKDTERDGAKQTGQTQKRESGSLNYVIAR